MALVPGCHYYYLPWGNVKPVVVLSSEWEDVRPRIEALNMLLTITDRLVCGAGPENFFYKHQQTTKNNFCCVQEANLRRVQLEVKSGSDLDEVELRVVELLDQLISDCR